MTGLATRNAWVIALLAGVVPLSGLAQSGAQPVPLNAGAVTPDLSLDAVSQANAGVEALSRSGDECAVLVGLPSATQRARVLSVCQLAIKRLQQAEVDTTARVAALRTKDPEHAARLQSAEIGLRIPLLRARAQVLAGVAESNGATLTAAIEQLRALDPIAVAPATLRRYLLAVALYHREVINGGLPGSPSKDATEAVDLLRSVSDWPIGPDANSQHPPSLAAEVRFALIRVGTHARGDGAIALRSGDWEEQPPFVVRAGGTSQELAEPGLFVRHAEARAAALAALWVARPGKVTFEQLIEPIAQSVRSGRMAVPANAKNREQLAQQRAAAVRESLIGRAVGSILQAGGSQLELPPWAVVSGAAELARDPGTREMASIILEGVLRRKDLGEAEADALFFSAMTLAESERAREQVEAVRRATRSIEQGLREPRRAVLLANLPAVAAQAQRRAESVTPRDASLVSEAADARIAALRASGRAAPAVAMGQGAIDLAKTILRKAGSVEVLVDGRARTVNRVDPATLIEALEALRPSADPQAKVLADAAIDAALIYGQSLLVNSTNPAAAGQGLVRVAEAATDWSRDADRVRRAQFRIALADGYAAMGDPRAVPLYDQLLSTEPPPVSPAQLTVRKARAQRGAGDPAAAFSTLRTLVEVLENAPAASRPPEYFAGWADMLEMLAADNAGGRRTEQIRLRIAHLRSLPGELGSPETAERIDMIQGSLREVGAVP